MKNRRAFKAFKNCTFSWRIYSFSVIFLSLEVFNAGPKNPSAEQSITRPYELQNKINRSALYSLTFIFIKIFFIFCEKVNLVGLTSMSVSKVFSSFLYGDFPICVSDRDRVFLDGCVTTLLGLYHDNSLVLN